jgi:hypothetical protein
MLLGVFISKEDTSIMYYFKVLFTILYQNKMH